MTEPDYWMIRGEIWSSDIAFLEAHNGTSSEVQAAMDEWEKDAIPLYKSPVSTDKLSVEKLQEQLNTAKYFFKNILDVNPNLHGGNSVRHLQNCVYVMKISAEKALAALEGGEDE